MSWLVRDSIEQLRALSDEYDDGWWEQEPPPAPREVWEYAWDEEPDDRDAMSMYDPNEGFIDA